MCSQIADHLRLVSCSPERMLVDGNKAASLVRVTAEHIPSGRMLAFRLAQFTKFRGGKLIEMRAILDSFDVVEQVLERHADTRQERRFWLTPRGLNGSGCFGQCRLSRA